MTDRDPAELFEAERRNLLGVAYRLLGTMTDAEDVIQDVFERWLRLDRSAVANPAAYLTTMTTRASIDRLRSARAVREVYTGPWLPEPIPTDDDERSPAAVAELDESLTIGYLHLMEQLTPTERAAHLLHDVYDFSYREIAAMIGKDEVNCRQLASRARAKLKATRPDRATVPAPDVGAEICQRLAAAVVGGDVDAVMALMTDDVVHISDGGPDHRAARQPIIGPDRVARFLVSLASRLPDPAEATVEMRLLEVNLQPAMLVTVDDEPLTLMIVELADDLVHRLYAVVNPDKLRAVLATR